MTSTDSPLSRGVSELQLTLTIDNRLFHTDEKLPCLMGAPDSQADAERDLWFSPFRDRERAARQCLDCPFLGRCGYNAVISRATHGVWAGEVFPGDRAPELEPIYERLLVQFERRRPLELGDAPPPPLPDIRSLFRRRAAA